MRQEQQEPQVQQDVKKPLSIDLGYLERRRGSVVEPRTDANKEFIEYAQKEVRVRTPRRGRSKCIIIADPRSKPRNFPVGRLNNYNKTMKKHKGPLSFMSELESIHESNEQSDKYRSSHQEDSMVMGKDYSEEDAEVNNHDMGYSGYSDLDESMI